MVIDPICIEVCYAAPLKQEVIPLEVSPHCTIEAAIHQSGLLARYPEIDLTKQKVGIFGKIMLLSDVVKPNDRIEIYRPLQIDPKDARRKRANQR